MQAFNRYKVLLSPEESATVRARLDEFGGDWRKAINAIWPGQMVRVLNEYDAKNPRPPEELEQQQVDILRIIFREATTPDAQLSCARRYLRSWLETADRRGDTINDPTRVLKAIHTVWGITPEQLKEGNDHE